MYRVRFKDYGNCLVVPVSATFDKSVINIFPLQRNGNDHFYKRIIEKIVPEIGTINKSGCFGLYGRMRLGPFPACFPRKIVEMSPNELC